MSIANEIGALETILADMRLIAASCKGSRELMLALKSPIIKADKKLAILNAIFKSKVNSITSSYLELLVKKGRESLLLDVALEYIEAYNEKKGIIKAQLYTPVKVSEAIKSQFSKVVETKTGKKVELEEYIKEDLIGGYVLRIGDMQVDSSVKTLLNTIKKSFSENQYIPKL
jgi:F-type H+-transporting ATPase subunit delta